MLPELKRKKWLPAMILAAVVLILLGLYHDKRTSWGSNDFDTYHFAGGLVLSQDNLYVHEAFRTTISPFLYLPFFAVLIAPLSLMGIRAAGLFWYLISLLSFGGAVLVTSSLVSGSADARRLFLGRPYLFKAASVVLIVAVWVDNVSLAQVDVMIFFMVASSLLLYQKKRMGSAGLLLAAAAVIKIYPFYVMFYMLVKRRFAILGSFLAGLVLFLFVVPWAVLGNDNYRQSMRSWLEVRAAPYLESGGDAAQRNFAKFEAQLKPKNQSMSAVVTRFLIRDDDAVTRLKTEDFEYRIYWPHPFSPRQVDITVKVLLFAVFLFSFLSVDHSGAFRGRVYQGLEYSVIFLSMLMLFPMVKSHTFAPLLFPVMLLCHLKDCRQEKWLYGSRGLEAAFYGALLLYALQGVEYMQVLGAGFFSVLVLWAMFLVMLWKEKTALKAGEAATCGGAYTG